MTDTRPHFWIDEENILYGENYENYYFGIVSEALFGNTLIESGSFDDWHGSVDIGPIESIDNIYIIYIEPQVYNWITEMIGGSPFLLPDIFLDFDCPNPTSYYTIVGELTAQNNYELYIEESSTLTGSWSINNKTVQSLHIGNKEIQTIERVSDGAIIYQRTPAVYELTLTSDKATVSTDETVTFTATLILNNQAVNGETVTFTDGTNTLGTATTNSNGVATLTYSWNSEDTYNVYAIYGNVESDSINIEVTILTLIFTGSTFILPNNSENKGLIGSNMVIYWGDGTSESITSNTQLPSHTYTTSKTYTIKVTGEITSLGGYCFSGCTGLTDITIPSSVTSLRGSCFSGCTGLTDITIPSSVTSLEAYCFSGCTGLTDITIPSSVTSLGGYCFSGCTGLTDITIPSSVTSLRSNCFSGCTGLTDITIPSSVTSLGGNCFSGCTGLTDITIPSSVTSLGGNCFRNCNNLINYQLYWQTPPKSWSSSLMPNNTNTYFTIPNGTTANYVAKSFPSAKLIERSA